jgi:hypothetical protein
MIYVCAGMYRSGSTWVYNAARLLLEEAKVPDLAAGWIAERERILLHRNAVVKIHEFDEKLAARGNIVLTSHRDLRDIAASLSRKFNFTMETLRETVEAHAKWERAAVYDLRYENLLTDRMTELRNMAARLNLPAATAAALPYQKILDRLTGETFSAERATSQRFDAVNLLHEGHVTDGRHGSWTDTLPEDVVSAIEKEFRPWLVARGYLS